MMRLSSGSSEKRRTPSTPPGVRVGVGAGVAVAVPAGTPVGVGVAGQPESA